VTEERTDRKAADERSASPSIPGAAAPPAGPQRVFLFEGLRGLLAWWVVGDHLLRTAGYLDTRTLPPFLAWVRRGDLPVDVFILLSGFVIAHALGTRREGYAPFLARRAFRLWPVLAVCFAAAVLLRPAHLDAMAAVSWSGDGKWSALIARMAAESDAILERITAHGTMLHGLLPKSVLPDAAVSFLGPSWSISLEWQFYLAAPLVFLLLRRSVAGFVLLLAVAASCVFLTPHLRAFENPTPSFLPLRFPWFLAGMLSWMLHDRLVSRQVRTGRGVVFAGAVAALAALVALRSVPATIWAVAFAAVLLVGTGIKGRAGRIAGALDRIVSAKPLRRLGDLSYATYLVHAPVLAALQIALVRIAPDLDRAGTAWLLLATAPPLTYVLSALLHRFVETPGIDAGRRVAERLAATRA
jgi:peptidoglycan/LPS O-acetylase OafA/YrhL